ncbi:MAG: peptidase MA family metallohydrolase [Chthoniobacterales bacterium]
MRLALWNTMSWRWASIAFTILVFCLLSEAHGQISDTSSLREIEFSQLSERDPNPLGEKALAIQPEQWKHSESDHFIYHFAHTYVATPISVEAEFNYRVITKELEREQPSSNPKCHIYIFENADQWHQFQSAGQLEKWTGGIHSAGSLFIQRNPAYKFTNNSLGHEIAHLVLHRFYTDSIPCWVDEGFAQYVSKNALSSYQRARGYISKPHSQSIAVGDLLPLSALLSLTHPPSERVETFYDESERLVRFLVATDKRSFFALLDALARHQPFDRALSNTYAGTYGNVSVLEDKFREYAAKDFGTALQQVSSD